MPRGCAGGGPWWSSRERACGGEEWLWGFVGGLVPPTPGVSKGDHDPLWSRVGWDAPPAKGQCRAAPQAVARRGFTGSDDEAEQGLEIMQRRQTVDINERGAQWRQEGWTHTAAGAAAQTPTPVRREPPRARQGGADATEGTIPVVEEEISVGKREVQRGRVRIHSRVVERPVEE